MAYASRSGRARTSAKSPRAFGVCDRCGQWWNWVDLRWQFDWRGPTVQNLRILVCKHCYDTPQAQLRSIVLPQDPVPIINARPEYFIEDETDYHTVNAAPVTDPVTGIPIPPSTLLVTADCLNVTQQPFGHPDGLEQDAVMPWNGVKAYAVPLAVLAVNGNGTTTVTVTCSAVHNLVAPSNPQQPLPQVSIEGLSFKGANGFKSVTVTTATAFTFQTLLPVPSESLLTPTTRIVTADVGLPYGYTTITPAAGANPFPKPYAIELESGAGGIELESGEGFIGLEQ